MLDPVRIELGPETLRDHIDVVILKVLRHARHERDADRGPEQQADAFEELTRRVLLKPRRVLVDHVPEDQRIEEREDLVDRGQGERERDEAAVLPEITVKKFHDSATEGTSPFYRLNLPAIRAEERVYRKSGEGLSKWERRDLQKDLNKTSREIYRAKHNNREPK